MTTFDPNSSSDSARSAGPFPWPEATAVLRSVMELNQAFSSTWARTGSSAVENWPKTEREILKWHKTVLYMCIDVVDGAIQGIDRAEAAAAAARPPPPPAPPCPMGREKITVQ